MQVLFLFPGTALFIVCAGPYGNSHGGASVYAAGKQPRLLLLLKEPLERKINRTCVRAAERYAAARVLGNTAQFTADALSVTSLADFPATVTKMLANTQSIRCAFCLTCQKTGRRDSTLRIVRYCLNIHYQFVTIAAKCKNPSFENVLCFKRERAVSRAPQACRSI